MLLHDTKHLVDHCTVGLSPLFDILLSVALLKMHQFVWRCDGVTLRKLQVKLDRVSYHIRATPTTHHLRSVSGLREASNRLLNDETNQTAPRN